MTKPGILLIMSVSLVVPSGAEAMDVPRLLEHCTANLDQFRSWTIQCRSSSQWQRDGRAEPNIVEEFDLRCDGAQMCNRRWLWSDVDKVDRNKLDRAKAEYMRLLWDGQTYKKYLRGTNDAHGTLFLDDFSSAKPGTKEYEVQSIQTRHEANFGTGYCRSSFDRIDVMLREAQTATLRKDMEKVNDTACYVVDATTPCGDLTVWIDPDHGYAIARHRLEASKAAGHRQYDRGLVHDRCIETSETAHFECVDGVWIGLEAIQHIRYMYEGIQYTQQRHIRITEFIPNPDHEKLRSFQQDDVPNGTLVMIPPITHILYVWQDGDLIKHIDEEVVRRIDAILATMMQTESRHDRPMAVEREEESIGLPPVEDANGSSAGVRAAYPHLGPRPNPVRHEVCGDNLDEGEGRRVFLKFFHFPLAPDRLLA
jgi:surface antigen